jgi:osmotically-inducible protein OsmY
MRASSRSGTKTSRDHARWVREHPRIDDSAFPEYPDQKSRRGSSRGALPNGNPWGPESDAERPGPKWARAAVPASATVRVASQIPNRRRRVEAPPRELARVAVTGTATTRADRRLASDIETRLAQSKALEGKCIEVSVHGEDAFLRGRLPTLDAKLEAGILASSVRGVARVHNQIRVEAS